MEGVVGVGKEDGEFPSLADTIAAVRRDLSAAQTPAWGRRFSSGPGRWSWSWRSR